MQFIAKYEGCPECIQPRTMKNLDIYGWMFFPDSPPILGSFYSYFKSYPSSNHLSHSLL